MRFGVINIFASLIIAIMMIPNIIYAAKIHNTEALYTGRIMCVIEQIGRYASIVFMIIPLGVWEFGFSSKLAFAVYILGNIILLFVYLVVWGFYFKKRNRWKALMLAIIPACIFFISGLTLRHWLLTASAIMFGIGHIYITYENNHVEL